MVENDILKNKKLHENDSITTIVLVPGSLNLRIGMCGKRLPKIVPAVVARKLNNVTPHRRHHNTKNNHKSLSQDDIQDVLRILEGTTSEKEAILPDARSNIGNESQEYKGDIDMNKHVVVGEEALKYRSCDSFVLRYPLEQGYFSLIGEQEIYNSRREILDDLEAIWNHAVQNVLGISRCSYPSYSVVLVIQDIFIREEVCDMVDILLCSLGFKGVMIHQQSVCISFGAITPLACVVDIGDQSTKISCVEDGTVIPGSSIYLPYGGRDVSVTLLWMLKHLNNSGEQLESLDHNSTEDMICIQKLKERESHTYAWGQWKKSEITLPMKNISKTVNIESKEELALASYSLLFPQIMVRLGPRFYPWIVPQPSDWKTNGLSTSDETTDISLNTTKIRLEELPGVFKQYSTQSNVIWSLSDGIMKSIQRVSRGDVRRRLQCNIVLVGGVALTPGLLDAVQSRVSTQDEYGTPPTCVVSNQSVTPDNLGWYGASMLALTESANDMLIPRTEWEILRVDAIRKHAYFLW